MQVVFVDSEESAFAAFLPELERLGIQAVCLNSGQQTLEYLQEGAVDIVVCGLSLPDMHGLDFLQHLQDNWPEVYRVVLSATYPEDSRVQSALQSRLIEQYFHCTEDWWLLQDYFARLADYSHYSHCC